MNATTKQRTVTVAGIEFRTAGDAIQWHNADPKTGAVISVGGRYFAVTRAEADRLDALGVVGAFWFDRDGVVVSVPCD
jgi:hypothetical protein